MHFCSPNHTDLTTNTKPKLSIMFLQCGQKFFQFKIKQIGSTDYTPSPPLWQELFISLGFSVCVVCAGVFVCVRCMVFCMWPPGYKGQPPSSESHSRPLITGEVLPQPLCHSLPFRQAEAENVYLPALNAYHSGHACGTSHG